MSGSNDLNININANNRAEPSIAQLQRNVTELGRLAANANDLSRASLEKAIAAIQREIAARQQQAAAINQVGAASGRVSTAQATAAASQLSRIKAVADAELTASTRSQSAAEAASARSIATSSSTAASQLTAIKSVADARLGADAKALTSTASSASSQLSSIKAVANAKMEADAKASSSAASSAASQLTSIKSVANAQMESAARARAATTSSAMSQLSSIKAVADAQMESSGRVNKSAIAAASSQLSSIKAVANAELESSAKAALAAEQASNRMRAASASAAMAQLSNIREVANAQVVAEARMEAAVAQAAARSRAMHASVAASQLASIKAVADAQMRMAGGGGSGANATRGFRTAVLEIRHLVALFDELVAGRRGAFFSTLGAAARDSGIGIAGLATSVGALSAVLATAAVLHGAENMGKWAEQTRAAASAAGMSIQSYSTLQGALVLVGEKAEGADATLRHLAQTSAEALANPLSKAAEAFHNLGISQEQLMKTGGNVSEVLHLLADAFASTQDGANKSENLIEIFGRGIENIIPALARGGQGLDELKAKAESLGLKLTPEMAEKLSTTGESVKTLAEKIKGDAIGAFVAWGPAIEGVTRVLGGLSTALGTIIKDAGAAATAVVNAAKTMGTAISTTAARGSASDLAVWLGFAPLGNRGPVPGITPTRNNIRQSEGEHSNIREQAAPLIAPITAQEILAMQLARDKATASGKATTSHDAHIGEASAQLATLQQRVNDLKVAGKENTVEFIRAQTEAYNKQAELNNAKLSGGGKASQQATRDDLANMRARIAAAQGASAQILAIYDAEIAKMTAKYGAGNAIVQNLMRQRTEAVTRAQIDEVKEGVRQEEQASRLLKLNTELAAITAGKFKFAGQTPGPIADLDRSRAALGEASQLVSERAPKIAELQQSHDMAPEGSKIQKETADALVNLQIDTKTKLVALYKEAGDAAVAAANKTAEAFKSFFDSAGSQFESFSTSAITALVSPQMDYIKAGLTTIKTSMQGNELRAAARTLFLGIVNDFAKSLETGVSKAIANAISGGASNTIGEYISKLLTSAIASVTGSAATSAVGNVAGSAAGDIGNAALSATISQTSTTSAKEIVDAIGNSASTMISNIVGALSAVSAAIFGTGAAEATATTAAGVNPEIFGFKFAQGGIVPSAAGGMMVGGPGASLAILHEKEMVLPAPISQGIQQMISRGGNNSNSTSANLNYSPTINTGSRGRSGTGMTRGELAQMMALHSGAMLGEARNMIRSGWRPA